MEKENDETIEMINTEREQFIYHIDQLENIECVYNIEDMGNESPEQEYLMYIEDHCKELKCLINKLYDTKLYIIKTVQNNIELRRDKIDV